MGKPYSDDLRERVVAIEAGHSLVKVKPFDDVSFGPGDRVIDRPRRAGDLRQIWRWVRAHEWPAQVRGQGRDSVAASGRRLPALT
jgi:hypothetical protein